VSEVLAVLTCAAGGFVAGLVGVGGGVLFVPAMTIFLDYSQVGAESTSLLMIVFVAIAGTVRQRAYGNVQMRDALVIGLLSPLGVLAGVVLSNAVSERVLQIAFAAFALFVAFQLVRRARAEA
jgi:uncharacterized membrane protein YfcA